MRGPTNSTAPAARSRCPTIAGSRRLAKAMHDAAMEAGIPDNPDFNGATQEGVGYYQTTINKARRWSSARAYLGTRASAATWTIATGAHATRLLIENGRAVGVEYRTPAGLVTARATREVIVSGGVYGSPQLLMLSGLGPAAHLQQHGIAGDRATCRASAATCTTTSTPMSPIAAPSR